MKFNRRKFTAFLLGGVAWFSIGTVHAACGGTSCTVTNTADTLNFAQITLPAAITYADNYLVNNPNATFAINFDPSLAGQTITLTTPLTTIEPNGGTIQINGASSGGIINLAGMISNTTGVFPFQGTGSLSINGISSSVIINSGNYTVGGFIGIADNNGIVQSTSTTGIVSSGGYTSVIGGVVGMNSGPQQISLNTAGGTLDTGANTAIVTTPVSASGGLTKTGSGTLLLDASATYTNPTTVSEGTIEVGDASNPNATLTSSVTIQPGGTVMGHGTIVGTLTNNGTVQPGGTIGTLTVNGNYTSTPNSVLAIELNPSTSSRLAVTGTASLNGTLALLPDAGVYQPGTQYTIVTAGNGVTGQFSNVENFSFIDFNERYLSNAVILTNVTTPNEQNIDGAITSLINSPTTGPVQAINLFGLGLEVGNTTYRPQLAGILGEARADGATIVLANTTSFQSFLTDRMDRRQELTQGAEINSGLPGTFDVAMNDSDLPLFGPGGAIDAGQPQFWARGYGVLGTLGGETGFQETQYRTGGVIGGADVKIGDGALIGAAIAYEHTDLNLSGDSDENNIDTYRINLYASQKLDPIPLVLDGALGYAFNDYHNNDFLPLASGGGFSQTSRHDGNELTADAGLSQSYAIAQDVVSGALRVVPRVGIEYDNISQTHYATTGAPDATVNFLTNGSTLNALRSTIGGKADLKMTTNNGTVITPELRASYLHDFMDTNVTLTEAFAGAPSAGFRISGVHPGREAALVGTGVTVGFSQNISAMIGYDAAIRQNELDHTVQAGLKYSW